jgi:hypothetical protein
MNNYPQGQYPQGQGQYSYQGQPEYDNNRPTGYVQDNGPAYLDATRTAGQYPIFVFGD